MLRQYSLKNLVEHLERSNRDRDAAIYQIRRAVVQLADDRITLSDAAESVLAQLRAYLESLDNAK